MLKDIARCVSEDCQVRDNCERALPTDDKFCQNFDGMKYLDKDGRCGAHIPLKKK
ncbi:MAG: hypothetical protein R8M45_04225 [Ghiorsea sp.]